MGIRGIRLLVLVAMLQALLVAAQPSRPKSWAERQKEQSWALDRLTQSGLRNEWVTIEGEKKLKAWVEYPKAKGRVPVVLVLHEVFGLTDSTRNTADRIAGMGYIVIVPDLLSGYGSGGGGVDSFTEHDAQVKALLELPDQAIDTELNRWADYGAHLKTSNGSFAIVGLSWGGGAAFHYATANQRKDFKAAFVFYDVGPPRETQKFAGAPARVSVEQISVPVYGFYPENDTRVMKSIEATRNAMAAAKKRYELVVYEGADHAFMREADNPANTNPANTKAWNASLERLQFLLKGM